MYELLTDRELTVLQSMLHEAAEEAYGMARANDDDASWRGRFVPLHKEVAHLFLEAGTALIARLDGSAKAA